MLILYKWSHNGAESVVFYDTYYTVLWSSLYFLANTPRICKQTCSFAKLLNVWAIQHYLISYKQNDSWVIKQRGLEESGCVKTKMISLACSDILKPRKNLSLCMPWPVLDCSQAHPQRKAELAPLHQLVWWKTNTDSCLLDMMLCCRENGSRHFERTQILHPYNSKCPRMRNTMKLKAETSHWECPASQELECSVVAEGLCKVSVASIDETMEDCLSSYFSVIKEEGGDSLCSWTVWRSKMDCIILKKKI